MSNQSKGKDSVVEKANALWEELHSIRMKEARSTSIFDVCDKSCDMIVDMVCEIVSLRQSPQINIDELTGVIESEITRFVPNAKDKFADVLAQAITSHLNGKGDGDE